MIIFAFTENGRLTAKKISQKYKNSVVLSDFKDKSFAGSVKESFAEDCLVFVGAAGIAVRAIAPYIKSKQTDPAVIVVDEKGEFVIPILSGHLGGANIYSNQIAEWLCGQAVITTATDINNVFAVDVWAKENGFYCHNIKAIKHVSSALLKGKKVGLHSDFPIKSALPPFLVQDAKEVGVYITNSPNAKSPFDETLFLIPKKYVLGIGCRKDIDNNVFEKTLLEFLKKNNIKTQLISAAVSIDLKKNEKAIVEFCKKYKIDFFTYSASELKNTEGEFTQSNFVKSVTGVDNVCERSAAFHAKQSNFLIKKTAVNGITFAVVKKDTEVAFCI